MRESESEEGKSGGEATFEDNHCITFARLQLTLILFLILILTPSLACSSLAIQPRMPSAKPPPLLAPGQPQLRFTSFAVRFPLPLLVLPD